MRKALIGLIMAATAATPVAASVRPPAHADRAQARAEQQVQRSEQRVERQAQRAERRQVQAPAQQVVPVQVAQRSERGERRDRGDRGPGPGSVRNQIEASREASRRSAEGLSPHYQRKAAENQRNYERQLRENVRERREDRRDYRQDRRDDRRDWRGDIRDDRRDWRNDRRWNNSWRQDRRYDWQRYRYQNRNIYRPGRYYSPYRGIGYSRLGIGLTLNSGYYGSRYWINDPSYYRLPPAPGWARWVRYYDDVILVDIHSGQVIDVIHDFFW